MGGVHAKLSPSGAHRWMRCPASPALEAEFPNDASPYAAEGTVAHDIAATCLLEDRSPYDFVGTTAIEDGYTITVDKVMAAHVEDYMKLVRDYAKDGVLLVEQQVPIGHLTGEEGATGTSDAVIVHAEEKRLTIIDLKYGMGVKVYADSNEQAMMYGLGALERYEQLCDFDEVCMVIHQPRLNHVAEHWLKVEELQAFAKEVEAAAELTRSSVAPMVPGEKQCKFCKAKWDCTALQEIVDETTGEVASADDFAELAELGDNSLSVSMGRVELIEQWCKAIRAEVERRLTKGLEVPGYKLVEGKRGNRAWKDQETTVKALSELLHKDEMYESKLISPATAEKLLKKDPDGRKLIEDLTTRPEGKPSVAPATDPRPEKVVTAVADDFADR